MKKLLLFCLVPLLLSFLLPVLCLAHPFDDLSVSEIKQVVKIIRESKQFPLDVRFPVVKRAEPKKADWLAGKAKDERLAYAAIFDIHRAMLTEVIADLHTNKILSAKELPGIQPPVLLEEYDRAREIIRADAGWQNAMKKRGFTNLEDLFIDPWAPGLLRPEEKKPGQRLLRGLTYVKGKGKNFYSRPVEGVVVTVDLASKKVISVWDVEAVTPAKGNRELGTSAQGNLDPAFPPIEMKLPMRLGYSIDGQEVTWGRWKFRYSMDPMQGLQLYHVRFRDGDTERTIIYKISLAEMLVPYGNPLKSWSFRNAFDVGEYGVGKTLHPLVAGQDVPVYATLLDTVVPDDLGNDPTVINGMAIYERDAGILWKHRNAENGDVDFRHARELVITFMCTVGNYDYGVNYIFKLDGTLQVDVQLTGILLAKGT
ncbi:MAG: copper amine oxidase, partial [Bdellovibrionota bacterium]